MNRHERIDDENLVELYVLGRLPAEEQERFEDHFADCPRCLEAVEAAQDLREGLRARAEDEATAFPGSDSSGAEVVAFPVEKTPPAAAREPQPPAEVSRKEWLRWVAVLVVALLPSWWLADRNAELRRQVERLERPFSASPHALLELQRNSGSAVSRVTPSPDNLWIHLAVDLGDLGGVGLDRVEQVAVFLSGEEGEILWHQDGLSPPLTGPFHLTIPRRWLVPGTYRLDTSLRAGNRVEPVGPFYFEVARAP